MGPAQSSAYRKQQPVSPNGYGPQKAQGVPMTSAPDTGPYFRAVYAKMWANGDRVSWALQNPTATGLGLTQTSNDPDGQLLLGAERELYTQSRFDSRIVSGRTDVQEGMGGPYHGLGKQPREALPTAVCTKVARTGPSVVGGNCYAFLPPPDKFLILNLRKVHPVPAYGKRGTLTRAGIPSAPSLGGTQAPRGNG